MRKTISPIILVMAMCCLAGCSPYVRMDKDNDLWPFTANSNADQKIITDANKPDVTIDAALDYANLAKSRYLNKLDHQGEIASAASLGAIPLAAVGVGLGVTGGSSAAVAAAALGSGTLVALDAFYFNKPEQRAYLAGYIAVGCAIDLVIPLRYFKDKGFGDQLKTALDALADQQQTTTEDLIALNSLLAASSAENADAKQVAMAAQAQLDSASDAFSNGWKLLVTLDTAGFKLKNAVDQIIGGVNARLVEAAPDSQQLAQIISGLSQGYNQFKAGLTPPAAPAKPGGVKVQSSTPIAGATNTLRNDLDNLRPAILRVKTLINTVGDPAQFSAGLKACGVAMPLVVQPPGDIQITEGQVTTIPKTVTGGQEPYTVAFAGDASGLQVNQLKPFGPAFTVHADGSAKAGDYVIQITDITENTIPLLVHVAKKSSGQQGGTDQPAGGNSLQAAIGALNGQQPSDDTYKYSLGNDAKVDDDGKSIKITVTIARKDGQPIKDAEQTKVNSDAFNPTITAAMKQLKSVTDAHVDVGAISFHFAKVIK